MSKGRIELSDRLKGIDNSKSKQSISIPIGQPKAIQRLFRLILSQLNGVKLCQQDTHAILLLAKNLHTIQQADKELNKSGMVLITKSGYQQPSPYIAIRNKAETQAVKLMKQLGMTPAARKEQGAKPTTETTNELDNFLNE